MTSLSKLPERHPLKGFFRNLTSRAMKQSSLTDKDLLAYLSDMLIHFVKVDHLYYSPDDSQENLRCLVDMLAEMNKISCSQRRPLYQHIADYSLFILGMYPESLKGRRNVLPRSYYVDTGRRCYLAASHLESDCYGTAVFRKLARSYERCVLSLNWFREYTHDPFYQYMLRQFGVT